jgi:uncharacterized protein
MFNRKLRIMLDTNLWISFILTKDYSKLDQILDSKSAVLLFSAELLDEFLEVVRRPKFRKYFSQEDLLGLLNQIETHAEIIRVNSIVKECRDSKDDFLLALAMDGNATHLITGDLDLLSMKKFKNTEIVTMGVFLNAL